MSKTTLTRVLFSVVSFAVAITALMFAASIVARTGLSNSVSLGAFAWIVPVVAGMAVGLHGWLLLSDARRSESDSQFASDEQGCPTCGRGVMKSWRLCPYCGSFIGSEDRQNAAGYAPVKR